MEHLWQFIRRFEQQSPELYTIRANTVTISSGELKSENLLFDPDYNHSPQDYVRTTQLFNGYPIWQAKDQKSFIVAANVPVSEMPGYVEPGELIDYPFVAIYPDPAGPSTVLAWKVTKAADIGSISDGLITGDLVRGTMDPLEVTPRRILGVVEGGDNPLPGMYFRDLQWLPGEQSVFFTQALSVRESVECIEHDVDDALPITVASGIDLVDLLDRASSSCEDLGLDLVQFITETDIDTGPGPLGEVFFAQAVACCGSASGESSTVPEEESSSIESGTSSGEPSAPSILYTADNVNLYTVDKATGTKTIVGSGHGAGVTFRALAWDPVSQTLYGANTGGGLYTFDRDTGVATYLGLSPLGDTIGDFTPNPAETKFFATTYWELYETDLPVNSSWTFKTNTPGSDPGAALATIPGVQAYITRSLGVFPVDLDAGTVGDAVVITGATTGIRSMCYVDGVFYAIDITSSGGSGRFGTFDPITGVYTAITGPGTWWNIAAVPESSS